MQTPENFRSLAATLLAARTPAPDEPSFEILEEIIDAPAAVETDDEQLGLLRDVRLFHARVIEAVDAAVETLVADIAADVLGRELLLAPAEIEAIVDRALARFAAEEPVRVRVHGDDAVRITCGVPVVPDARLRPGDAVIELRNGSIDACLGVRLHALLQAAVS